VAEEAPEGPEWISEIKFDGYRLLAYVEHGRARLVTRNLHDWTARLPAVAALVGALGVDAALLDGELVALKPDGTSSFPDLQAALSAGADEQLYFYAFDLLHLNGWDLRPCRLLDRKAALKPLDAWQGRLRYSDHFAGDAAAMRRQACGAGLEGIICKRADAPYRAGRNGDWLKVKCRGREEFVVLGWTPPSGSRTGIGALHVGFYDHAGKLHYVGGVGSGFSEKELGTLRERLDALAAEKPEKVLIGGDPLDASIRWVRPELVAEVQYAAWSGSGRIRHAVFLGLREDKAPREVVRDIPDPDEPRKQMQPRNPTRGLGPAAIAAKKPPKFAVPPIPPAPELASQAGGKPSGRIVVAPKPQRPSTDIAGIEITHPDRALWPGITKRDLAEYWQAVADRALPGLAHRPLAILRCPEGIAGEHFFQKRGHNLLPPQVREGTADGSPYLAIDDREGLIALAQMSAIELHPWGAAEADALHPDWIVFDLDPGEGVPFPEVVRAALDLRKRLEALGLAPFPRTTGGKGLHLVVPLEPRADWEATRAFCRAFAELMSEQEPDRFLPVLQKAQRKGRILIDWLRNGLGATAIASFSPRARPGATVATPLAWREVTPKLDPAAFTLRTIPARLAKLKRDPWDGFRAAACPIPKPERAAPKPKAGPAPPPGGRRSSIVYAPRAKR
jgi:bifunctional non-homologous end joining protein LigD